MNAGVTSLLMAVLLTAAAARPAIAARARPSDLLSSAPTWVNRIGQIVAPVMIDAKGPFRILVDTGADGSMVPRLVRALGLVPVQGSPEQVEGVTGTEPLPWMLIRRLRVGRIVKTDVPMPISPSPIMTRLDGILGMAGFGPVRIAVYFRHNRVSIDRLSRGMLCGHLDIRARRTPGGLLMIPVHVAGIAVEAVIETGSPDTLRNLALHRGVAGRAQGGPGDPDLRCHAPGVHGAMALAPTLILGSAATEHLPILCSDVPIFSEWHLKSRLAVILGMDVLGATGAPWCSTIQGRVYILRAPPPGSMVGADLPLPGAWRARTLPPVRQLSGFAAGEGV